ncbi:MAG: glycosyltransferase family 4 protein [Syntrophomonas sp.]|nr:glycosyltransferase family 4 protein [Syntrophomonas sp.]
MDIYIIGMIFLAIMSSSAILVYLVRRYALRKGIVDVPNKRSSHRIVTPRGGGLGFVIPFIFSVIVFGFLDIISLSISMALAGGGSLIALLGWADDKNGLTARVRVFFHFLAAVWAVFCLGGFPALNLGFVDVHLSWLGSLVAVIGTVWLINMYNFMDGIDGIAGAEAISVALAAGVLLFLNSNTGLALICGMLACSVAGFLLWNWPPARIFMGDAGSGFLGYFFACLAIASENTGAMPFIIWILLLGVFVIDATCTLFLRVSQGNKCYEAHRSHVYQLAVQAGYSHKQVTLTVLAINCGLAAIAYSIFKVPLLILPISLTTAVIMVVAYKYLRNKYMKIIEQLVAQSRQISGQGLLEAAAADER